MESNHHHLELRLALSFLCMDAPRGEFFSLPASQASMRVMEGEVASSTPLHSTLIADKSNCQKNEGANEPTDRRLDAKERMEGGKADIADRPMRNLH